MRQPAYPVDRRRFLSLLGLSVLGGTLSITSGCGGGSGSKPTGGSPTDTGDIQFRVAWPTSGPLSTAQSLVISAGVSLNFLGYRGANRSATTAEILLSNQAVGPRPFALMLCSGPDGSGEILYQSSFTALIEKSKQVAREIVFGDSYNSLALSDDFPKILAAPDSGVHVELASGLWTQIIATARDSQNRIVLVPAGQFTWTSSDPSMAYVLPSGYAFGRRAGNARISLRDAKSGQSASRDIVVPEEQDNVDLSNPIPLAESFQRSAWTVASGEIWSAGFNTGQLIHTLSAIDPNTLTVTRMIPLLGQVVSLAATGDGQGLFIVHQRTSTISSPSTPITAQGLALSFLDVATHTLQRWADLPADVKSIALLSPAPGSSRRVAFADVDLDTGRIGASVLIYDRGVLLNRTWTEGGFKEFTWGENDEQFYSLNLYNAVTRYSLTNDLVAVKTLPNLDVHLGGYASRQFFVAGGRILLGLDLFDAETGALIRRLPFPSGYSEDSINDIAGDSLATGRIQILFWGGLGTPEANFRLAAYDVESGTILSNISKARRYEKRQLIRLPNQRLVIAGAARLQILDNISAG